MRDETHENDAANLTEQSQVNSSQTRLVGSALERLLKQKPDVCELTPETYQRQPTARKVIRKGDRNHHVGLFASRLNQAMIPYESALEKQACALFESYSDLHAYNSQPYALRLYYAGKVRTVWPDFELRTADQNIIVDIRFEKHTRNPLFRERCEELEFYANQRGMAYTLMTENTIRGQRLKNTQWLLSIAIGKATPLLIYSVKEWVRDQTPATFGDLFDSTEPYPTARSVLASLALEGGLKIDWEQPLREQLILEVEDA